MKSFGEICSFGSQCESNYILLLSNKNESFVWKHLLHIPQTGKYLLRLWLVKLIAISNYKHKTWLPYLFHKQ